MGEITKPYELILTRDLVLNPENLTHLLERTPVHPMTPISLSLEDGESLGVWLSRSALLTMIQYAIVVYKSPPGESMDFAMARLRLRQQAIQEERAREIMGELMRRVKDISKEYEL